MLRDLVPHSWRMAAKRALAPITYQYLPFGIAPERLYVWLDALEKTRGIPGPILEVGCHLGGTAAMAHKMLKNTGNIRRYICVDTFGGFIDEQFNKDQGLGTPASVAKMFSNNSMDLVKYILARHDASEIELVQGDITKYTSAPDSISAVLLDVDLSEPTYEGLRRLYPKMAHGGIMCVDDCPEGTNWRAKIGYEQFCGEFNLVPEYHYGMGIIHKPR